MKTFKAAMLAALLCSLFTLPVYSQQYSGSCFAVSDSAIGESGSTGDALFSVDLGDFQNTSTNLGATGTNLTEGIVYVTHRDKLYYGNGTEIWVATGPNYDDPVLCAEVSGVTDIDGMTFDLANETFYIVDRNGTGSPGGGAGGAGAPEDELLALSIDNQCNISITAGPFNIETAVATGVADVDDIAYDPFDEKLYGIANNSNSSNSFLIEIDTSDGSLVGSVQMNMPYPDYDDIEGMTFTPDGDLLAITGESAGQTSNGEGPNSSEIYAIDKVNGTGILVGDLNTAAGSDRSDFESLSCGQAELCNENHSISGFIYNEDQAAPNGLANVEIKLRDANLNIIEIVDTNSDGIFLFDNLAPGTYNYDVNERTVPAGLIATSSTSGQAIDTELGCAPQEVEISYRNQVEGVIGDFVWHDYCSPNGIADPTELGLGLEGAALQVLLGQVVITNTATDSYGDYLVDGLAEGSYTVNMDLSDPVVEAFIDDQLAAQIQSSPNCPSAGKKEDSQIQLLADTTTPTTITDLLPAGGSNLDFDFALIESTLDLILNDFSLQTSGSQLSFHWTTSSEKDFAGFELEFKKVVDDQFATISFVPSNGDQNIESSYQYVIEGLSPARYIARLKMIDNDGQFSYSNVIEAELIQSSALITLYPNPVIDSGTVQIKGLTNGNLSVEVFDQLGRMVTDLYQGNIQRDQILKLHMKVKDLAPGLYVIEARQDGISNQQSLVISR